MVALPETIKQKTTKCENDFGCLLTGRCGNRQMCKVTNAIGPNVLQLATCEQSSCPYRVSFGYCELCVCPVRIYIHSRAHIWGAIEDWTPGAALSAQAR